MPNFLKTPKGEQIAYHNEDGASPTLIWCGGLKSDMNGSKALHLHAWAKSRGLSFIRFDYFGHGESSGDFIDGTLSQWAEDIGLIIKTLASGPCVLIGSSMGGWAALLAAIDAQIDAQMVAHNQMDAHKKTSQIIGLVLINPAPDFTEKLILAGWSAAQIKALEDDGIVYEPSGYDEPYAYSKALIDDGRKRQILDAPIKLTCPIEILQGSEDKVVPPAYSRRLLDVLDENIANYTLVKGADHSLSRPQDLRLIEDAILSICAAKARE